jgi:hypothetical protein
MEIIPLPCTIGLLVDLADAVPPELVVEELDRLLRSMSDRLEGPENHKIVTRHLVMVGALVNRVLFEIRGLPKDRGHQV